MLSREVTIEQDVELNQVSFSIYNKAHTVSLKTAPLAGIPIASRMR